MADNDVSRRLIGLLLGVVAVGGALPELAYAIHRNDPGQNCPAPSPSPFSFGLAVILLGMGVVSIALSAGRYNPNNAGLVRGGGYLGLVAILLTLLATLLLVTAGECGGH